MIAKYFENKIKSKVNQNINLDWPDPNSRPTNEVIRKWIDDVFDLLPESGQKSLVSNGNNPRSLYTSR